MKEYLANCDLREFIFWMILLHAILTNIMSSK